MNKIIIILCVAVLAIGCKSKKGIVTKKGSGDSKHVNVGTKNKKKDVIDGAPKVYANNTEIYIYEHKAIAQQEMVLYGIPASITLAQGILESGSGKGRLSVEANNHFGIKCHGWSGKKIYHDDDAAQECFRKYKDAKYSFRDHSLFLTERSRYSKLFKLKKEDYKGWAKGLRAAGYATDKKYPQKLISLIERYNLDNYDKEVLGEKYETYQNPISRDRTTYTVVKGDTLYSISRAYNISVNTLKNINGLRNSSLSIGQQLVVKPSSKN